MSLTTAYNYKQRGNEPVEDWTSCIRIFLEQRKSLQISQAAAHGRFRCPLGTVPHSPCCPRSARAGRGCRGKAVDKRVDLQSWGIRILPFSDIKVR